VAKNSGYFFIFQKNYPDLTITQWAKIRPIWSPCFWVDALTMAQTGQEDIN
jgi:hypothetical protein